MSWDFGVRAWFVKTKDYLARLSLRAPWRRIVEVVELGEITKMI